MDLYCPICLEPWDNDTLHEVAEETGQTYSVVAAAFRTMGCGVAFKGSEYEHNDCRTPAGVEGKSVLAMAVYDLLGDDMDGAAAAFDDGLLEFLTD